MTEAASFIPPEAAEPVAEEKPKAKRKRKKKGEAKVKKTPSLRRSKFKDIYPDDMPLAVLVPDNPKKKESKANAMFELYRGVTTVGEAIAAGITYQNIAYDVGRQFVKVG